MTRLLPTKTFREILNSSDFSACILMSLPNSGAVLLSRSHAAFQLSRVLVRKAATLDSGIPLERISSNQERIDMDIQSIVKQLREEAGRLEQAIAALVGFGSQPARRGRPPKGSHAKPASGPKRRRMSAAARARIAAAKKAWWAKQKGKSGPKKRAAVSKKNTGRKPMSPAMRKKLSAMMKARWAERKAKA